MAIDIVVNLLVSAVLSYLLVLAVSSLITASVNFNILEWENLNILTYFLVHMHLFSLMISASKVIKSNGEKFWWE